ncbi:MAG: hypothetical protein HZB64_00815 [Rhodocyclales bacterium]|nr:hypothetical protein [Rhodocyclales bacterium]
MMKTGHDYQHELDLHDEIERLIPILSPEHFPNLIINLDRTLRDLKSTLDLATQERKTLKEIIQEKMSQAAGQQQAMA